MNLQYLRDFIVPRLLLIAAVIGGILFTRSNPVHAATFDVPCDTNELQFALNAANSNSTSDTLNLAQNCTYTLNGSLPLITINEGLIINGNGTIIDGAKQFGGFFVSSRQFLTLNDITVQNGLSLAGGGIYNFGGTVTLNNVTVRNSTAISGGGIFYQHPENVGWGER